MAAVVIKGSLASAEDGNITFKALKEFCKAANFATGTIEVLVIP